MNFAALTVRVGELYTLSHLPRVGELFAVLTTRVGELYTLSRLPFKGGLSPFFEISFYETRKKKRHTCLKNLCRLGFKTLNVCKKDIHA